MELHQAQFSDNHFGPIFQLLYHYLHCYLVSIRKLRMRNYWFPIRKGGIFRSGQEIKELRGGILLYAAQVIPQIDTARAEKNPFRMETK
jgi:hypothetical protein